MSKYITVKLTEDQIYLLVGELEGSIYRDDNEQTSAFKQRTLTKLAQTLVTEQAKTV